MPINHIRYFGYSLLLFSNKGDTSKPEIQTIRCWFWLQNLSVFERKFPNSLIFASR